MKAVAAIVHSLAMAVAIGAVLLSGPAHADQPPKIPRIGALVPPPANSLVAVALRDGLRELHPSAKPRPPIWKITRPREQITHCAGTQWVQSRSTSGGYFLNSTTIASASSGAASWAWVTGPRNKASPGLSLGPCFFDPSGMT